MSLSDEQLRDRLVQELNDDEASLPPDVAQRLRDLRREARRRAEQPRTGFPWLAWQPALAVCAVGVLAFAVMVRPPSVQPVATEAPTAVVAVDVSTLDVLQGSDEIEFYQSVDFLLWLEQQG